MNKGQTHRHGKVGRGPPHPAAAACLLGTAQREVMHSLMEASVGEQSWVISIFAHTGQPNITTHTGTQRKAPLEWD